MRKPALILKFDPNRPKAKRAMHRPSIERDNFMASWQSLTPADRVVLQEVADALVRAQRRTKGGA